MFLCISAIILTVAFSVLLSLFYTPIVALGLFVVDLINVKNEKIEQIMQKLISFSFSLIFVVIFVAGSIYIGNLI